MWTLIRQASVRYSVALALAKMFAWKKYEKQEVNSEPLEKKKKKKKWLHAVAK